MNHPVTIRESECTIDTAEPVYSEPVNCLDFGNGYGTILYTSAEVPSYPIVKSAKERLKRLTTIRLVQFAARESAIGIPEADAVTLSTTSLGCPKMEIGQNKARSVSFTCSNGTVWAALGSEGYSVGIDTAEPGEFETSYPFHRAFNSSEMRIAMDEVSGKLPEASALLWTLKESSVKALGCGFHLVDPLQVRVIARKDQQTERSFSIVLAEEAKKNLGLGRNPFLKATAIRKHCRWLAIALFNPV